ncbi:tripartite tricarboxylate transporter substrate binding protein [Isoptericola sp. 4D.3]|uniref:Tripartite tricarboxylate transporter substrate binding protein n=1 Tax=Isoptericola peretonis TaxID=2918523 RepID=A0ABT0J013_9MICO|nr:tripartite tricarboxylate transporter substrate binding protein [Isoptericola sp. 4D.3]
MRAFRKTTTAALGVAVLTLSACAGIDTSGSGGGLLGEFEPSERQTMIVPMSAGGGSDLSGRAIASGLEEVTGRTMSVENQDGGGGAVGYANFLGLQGNASHLLATETALVNLGLTQDVPFNWESFTPVMKVGQDSTVVVVKSDSPYDTCPDVVDAAKEGKVLAAVSGGATGNDAIQFGLIEKDQGVAFQRVPYESGGEAIAAVLGGHVDVGLTNPGEVIGQFESGDLKPLCVIAEKRYEYEELADIPTTVEQGIDVTFSQFRGVIAPGGLTDEAVDYWVDASKLYVKTEAFQEYMSSNYMQVDTAFGSDFAAYLKGYEAELKAGLG